MDPVSGLVNLEPTIGPLAISLTSSSLLSAMRKIDATVVIVLSATVPSTASASSMVSTATTPLKPTTMIGGAVDLCLGCKSSLRRGIIREGERGFTLIILNHLLFLTNQHRSCILKRWKWVPMMNVDVYVSIPWRETIQHVSNQIGFGNSSIHVFKSISKNFNPIVVFCNR